MTPDPSDHAFVDALRAGRPEAFERLYADHRAGVYNLCARILGDREEAQDLTHDVFIKAMARLPAPGAEPLKLRPWLYRVATNACFNHLRARRRFDGDASALENAAAPVDEFERARVATLVEASLAALNERYRAALVLRDLQGLPADEIADVMEVSRPTADVLVHRARRSFRSAYRQLAGDGSPAPASLGLVLVPLSLPAALHTLPPLPASMVPPHTAPVVPAPHAVPHASPVPDLSTAGPVGAGLLTKIGAALSTKIGITAAAATLAVGGGAAVYETHHDGARTPVVTEAARADELADGAEHGEGPSMHDGSGATDLHARPHDRLLSGHRDDLTDATHTGTRSGYAGDGGGTSSHDGGTTTHDAGTGTSTTTHQSGSGSSTTTHDGTTDTSGDHESGAAH